MQKENRQFLAEYGARKAKETQEHDIEPPAHDRFAKGVKECTCGQEGTCHRWHVPSCGTYNEHAVKEAHYDGLFTTSRPEG